MSKVTQAVRDAFTAVNERELKLSDAAITGIINKVEDWDEMDDDDKIALLIKAEETAAEIAAKTSIADPSISALVAKIDDPMEAELTACVEATMKSKVTAVHHYAQLRRVYTKAELDETPYPGSEVETVFGNNRPDKVKTTDHTGKPLTKVFWNDFVSATARGKQYEGMISDIKAEQKTSGSVPHLRGKDGKLPSDAELETLLSDVTGKRNTLRSIWKRAVSLHHKFNAISEMPDIFIRFSRGAPNAESTINMPKAYGATETVPVTGAPKPIWIAPKDEPNDGRAFSVTQVLAFDPHEAIANGGTMAALVATAAKGSDDDDKTVVTTIDSVAVNITTDSAFLEKRENMAALQKKMNEPDSDDMVKSVCSMYLSLKPLYLKFQSRYEKILDIVSEEKEQEVA